MKQKLSLYSFFQLLYHDLFLLKREFGTKLIDLTIMTFSNIIVFGYLMPPVAMGVNYGAFILLGLLMIMGFFAVIANVVELVADITTDRFISYKLLLPLRSFYVFASIALSWGIISMLANIFMLPLGKLILLENFDLSKISIFRFIGIYVTSYILFGYFALWLASVIKSTKRVAMVWLRIATPLFMLGCYFYTWESVYQTSHILGSIVLLNPLIYSMEGIRAASLGQEGFLPYWVCLSALWGFILIFAWHSNKVLKKRLDCI